MNQDVRYALRIVRRQAAFSLSVMLTLAVGIGANAAVLPLLDDVAGSVRRALGAPRARRSG